MNQTKDDRYAGSRSRRESNEDDKSLSPRDTQNLARQGSLKRPGLPKRRSSSGMEGVQRSQSFKENGEKSPRERKNSNSGSQRKSSGQSTDSNGSSRRGSQSSQTSNVTNSWSSGFFSPRKGQSDTESQGGSEGRLEMCQHSSLRSLDSLISCSRSKLLSNEQEMSQLRIEKQHFDIIIRILVEWISFVKGVNRLSKAVPEMPSVKRACMEIYTQLQSEKSLFNSNFQPLAQSNIANAKTLYQEVQKLKTDIQYCIQNDESMTAKHVEDIRYALGYLKGALVVTRDTFC